MLLLILLSTNCAHTGLGLCLGHILAMDLDAASEQLVTYHYTSIQAIAVGNGGMPVCLIINGLFREASQADPPISLHTLAFLDPIRWLGFDQIVARPAETPKSWTMDFCFVCFETSRDIDAGYNHVETVNLTTSLLPLLVPLPADVDDADC